MAASCGSRRDNGRAHGQCPAIRPAELPGPANSAGFQPQVMSPLANLSAPSPFIPIPGHAQHTASLLAPHSPQNNLFGSPHAHLTPPAGSPAGSLPVTPEQIQQMIAQQVQALARHPNSALSLAQWLFSLR